MKDNKERSDFLRFLTTKDLFRELGKRLDIEYGKIEMKFRQGEPCEDANVERRIKLEEKPETNS